MTKMSRRSGENMGRAAYNAYCETRDWKSFDGEPLPKWEDVQVPIKKGWIEAANAVIATWFGED